MNEIKEIYCECEEQRQECSCEHGDEEIYCECDEQRQECSCEWGDEEYWERTLCDYCMKEQIQEVINRKQAEEERRKWLVEDRIKNPSNYTESGVRKVKRIDKEAQRKKEEK
jgi:hypothetical protein